MWRGPHPDRARGVREEVPRGHEADHAGVSGVAVPPAADRAHRGRDLVAVHERRGARPEARRLPLGPGGPALRAPEDDATRESEADARGDEQDSAPRRLRLRPEQEIIEGLQEAREFERGRAEPERLGDEPIEEPPESGEQGVRLDRPDDRDREPGDEEGEAQFHNPRNPNDEPARRTHGAVTLRNLTGTPRADGHQGPYPPSIQNPLEAVGAPCYHGFRNVLCAPLRFDRQDVRLPGDAR